MLLIVIITTLSITMFFDLFNTDLSYQAVRSRNPAFFVQATILHTASDKKNVFGLES